MVITETNDIINVSKTTQWYKKRCELFSGRTKKKCSCEIMYGVMQSPGNQYAVYEQDLNAFGYIKDGLYSILAGQAIYIPIWESKTIAATQTLHKKIAFSHLVEQWKQKRPKGADVSEMVMHTSYQRIIGMGPDVVPFLLEELEREPEHWFWALYSVTGVDPVPPESQGKLKEMAKAWIDWGKKQGYRW